jgi:hypothetical protein
MIYCAPGSQDPIDQPDIIEGCPLLSVEAFDLNGVHPPQINIAISRVFVLTQTCDLVNQKVTWVSVAAVLDAQDLVEQGLLKRDNIRGSIRAGRVFGWYFLPKSPSHGLPEMIVNLRQLHTVSLDLLVELCQRGQRRARLLCPYREHLAKHFADTFSRIGLPEPYETD